MKKKILLGTIDTTVLSTITDKDLTALSSWEEHIQVGLEARLHKDKAQWLLGKLAQSVENHYGEASLDKYAKSIGIPVTSLRVYRWVVSQYPNYVPPPTLSFSVLQTAAKLPQSVREEMLQQAEGGMSVEMVRRKVAQQVGKVIRPKFSIKYCEEHKKWKFTPHNPEEWEPSHEDLL